MALEYLRIVGESASFQRRDQLKPGLVEVRDLWIRSAARHHSIEELAEASKLSPEAIEEIVLPRGRGLGSAPWRIARRRSHGGGLSSPPSTDPGGRALRPTV